MLMWQSSGGPAANKVNSRKAALGTLAVKVELDRPFKTHYGPGSKASGSLLLQYTPHKSEKGQPAELYGPINMSLIFSGRVSSATVYRSGTERGSLATGMATPYMSSMNNADHKELFKITTPLQDTSLRIREGETMKYPFSVVFPAGTMPTSANRRTSYLSPNGWQAIPPSEGEENLELPPSFHKAFMAGPSNGDEHRIDVKYIVEADVAMPGLDVDIRNPLAGQANVLYEKPRITPDQIPRDMVELATTIQLRSSHFLPANEQPHGLKGKTKALLTSSSHYPLLSLAVSVPDIPLHISAGRLLALTIHAKPDSQTTCHQTPSIELKAYKIALLSRVTSSSTTRKIQSQWFDSRILQAQSLHPTESLYRFSDENDYTMHLITEPVGDITSSFENFGVALEYRLDVWLSLRFAGHEVKHVQKSYPVTVWPPLRQADAEPGGVSRRVEDDDELPPYSPAA